ncbi:MAG: polysaccharide biosynthesis tyrosine autokinase [Acidobacteriota bacterium]|nr:polysaccharide biosynthesis tyrosine autokinase [Acidobacteriota bacterium]
MDTARPADFYEESEVGLRDYILILYRRRWWFIGVYLAIIALITVITFTATPIYGARAKLLVEASRFGSTGSGASDVLTGITGVAQARTVETQIELIRSALVLRPALEKLGIDPETEMPGVIVETIPGTDIITVSARAPDPLMAPKIANGIAQEYVELTLQRNRQTATQGREFIEKQAEEVRTELAQAEADLTAFRQGAGITSVDEAVTSLIEEAQRQSEEANRADAQVAATQAEVQALRARLGRGDGFIKDAETVERNPAVDTLRGKLLGLEAERAALISDYAPTSQKVTAIDKQIAAVKKQLESQVDRVVSEESRVDPVNAEVLKRLALAEVELSADRQRANAVRRGLAEAQAAMDRLPDDQRQAAELERSVRVAENRYLTLMAKLQDLQLAEMVEIPSATVIQAADSPAPKVSPSRKKNLLFAIFFGFLVALGVALLVNYMDNTYASVQEMEEQLGVSTLAVIFRQTGRENILLSSPMGKSPFAEAFRMIRSALRFSSVNRAISSLVMTSVAMGEGKSTVSVNTAIACAEGGQRVILVDADLRRPSQHRIFDYDNTTGLTSCLVDGVPIDDVLHETDYPNLRIMTSGPIPPNPGELLDSSAMRDLVQRLKGMCDLVILDTPPGTILADAMVLTRIADAAVIVVDIESTKRPALRRLVELFKREGHFLPGVVINKAKQAPGSYYYYGSYYYSEYYGDED